MPAPRGVTSPAALSNTGPLPIYSNPSLSDFEIERGSAQSVTASRRVTSQREEIGPDEEYIFRDSISRVLAAKSRPFTVSGRIPFDPTSLVLFFRSKVSL
jgi:hypothetical protein